MNSGLPKKILHIEDSEEDRFLLRRYLKKMLPDVELLTAESVAEGIEKIHKKLPDCVLVDFYLPDGSARDVIQKCQDNSKSADMGIVVLTGRVDFKEAVNCIQMGAHDYVGKDDISSDSLRRAIVNSLNKVNLQRQIEKNRILGFENSKMGALAIIVGGVAHEINNPLVIFDGGLSMLEKHLAAGDEEKAKKSVEKLRETSGRIAKIVRDMQSFCGELSSGKTECVTPAEIVRRTEEFCRENLRSKNIRFEMEGEVTDAAVECSPTQLVQVLLGLIFNSVDAIKDSSEPWIKLATSQGGGFVVFSVTDSGTGIDEKVKENLMTPFFTTKEVGKGKGLGLSVSRGVVESYKGRLELDDTSPNTRFTVSLPAVEKKAKAA